MQEDNKNSVPTKSIDDISASSGPLNSSSSSEDVSKLALKDVENVHPADAADHLEKLSLDDQVHWVETAPIEDAAETIGEMEEHSRTPLLENLDPELAADILEELPPDDAVDILDELDEEHRHELLQRVTKEDAAHITNLMRFNPDTAGGVMTTETLVLSSSLSADEAIKRIRQDIADTEVHYYAYLVDDNDRLVGVPSLRDILLSKPGTIIGDLAKNKSLISVLFDVDKEEVAHQLRHYNFIALPVVDYGGRFLGVVTHDDVMDIIHEEASEDMLGMVGAGQDETVDTPWKSSVIKRLPWLFINLANSAVAAWVVHMFEGTIAQMAILAALMHIVSNQAGNTGQQSLAVIIRQLAMERFDRVRSGWAVWREVKIGLANGFIVGVIVFFLVLLITQGLALAEVMALSLGLNMFIGSLAGASIPLILKFLGRDPAQASSIFLTTITDTAGFFIFLGLAALMLF